MHDYENAVPEEEEPEPRLEDSKKITVCDECYQSSCWHGDFMCDRAQYAGTVEITVGELKKLGLEHPDHWEYQKEVHGEKTSEEPEPIDYGKEKIKFNKARDIFNKAHSRWCDINYKIIKGFNKI